MKLRSFVGFVAPSVFLMLVLLALPLVMTVLLSVRNCAFELELATVQQSGPFGTHEVTTQRAKLDAQGKAVEQCRWVGLDYYRTVLGLQSVYSRPATAVTAPTAAHTVASADNEFYAALRFTDRKSVV